MATSALPSCTTNVVASPAGCARAAFQKPVANNAVAAVE